MYLMIAKWFATEIVRGHLGMEEGRSRWPRLASTDVVDEERVDQPAETTMATGSSFGDPTNEGGTTRWPRPVWTPSTGSVNTSRLTPTGSVACGRAWSGCSWGRGQRPLRGRRRRAQPKAGEGPQPRGGPAPRRERRRRGRRLPRPRGDHPPGRLLAEDHEGWMVARHSMGVGWLRAIQAVLPDQEVALGLPHASSWSPGDTVVVRTLTCPDVATSLGPPTLPAWPRTALGARYRG